MNKKQITKLSLGCSFLLLFLIFTIVVKYVDVNAISLEHSEPVGLSRLNKIFLDLFNKNKIMYQLSNILGYIAILIPIIFITIAIIEWIKRKSIKKIDKQLFILGIFYVCVIIFYIIFEFAIVNYRPILIDGQLEASYPSSHTMLAICIYASTIIMAHSYNLSKKYFIAMDITLYLFMTLTVIFRLMSGVHWFTDILGGIILSIGLILIFDSIINNHMKDSKNNNIDYEE